VHGLVGSGGSFGGSTLQQEIGVGQATAIERVEIDWPGSGATQRFEGLEVGSVYRLVEGEREARPVDVEPVALGGVR